MTTNLTRSSRSRNAGGPRPGAAAPPRAGLGRGWLPARPGALPARALLAAVNLAAAGFFLLSFSGHGAGFGPYRIDLDVYRIGGRVWLRGGDLYGSAAAWALSLNAFAALLISPISWSHHWVWGETAVLTLALHWHQHGRRPGRRGALVAAGCGLAVFAAAPQWWFPSGSNRELRWTAWQQVAGSSYVVLAVALLLLLSAWWIAGREASARGRRSTGSRVPGGRRCRSGA